LFIHLNVKNDALKNQKVRQALNMAIDKAGLVKEVYAGTARVEQGMLSPGTFAYDPNVKFYNYDPEGAKKLLAEAAYANGLKLKYDTFQYGTGELEGVVLQLEAVGIAGFGQQLLAEVRHLPVRHRRAGAVLDPARPQEGR